MKVALPFLTLTLLYPLFAAESTGTRAACDGKGDIPTGAIMAVLDLSNEQFETLAVRAPAIAESLTYSMAVPSERTGAIDLRQSEIFLKGAPPYARSMASLNALKSDDGERRLRHLVRSPEMYTAVTGFGAEPDDTAHDYILTLQSFPVDTRGNDGGSETDRRTKAILLLSKTRRTFNVAHLTSPVAVYSVNAIVVDDTVK